MRGSAGRDLCIGLICLTAVAGCGRPASEPVASGTAPSSAVEMLAPFVQASRLEPPSAPPSARVAGARGETTLAPFFADWEAVDARRTRELSGVVQWREIPEPGHQRDVVIATDQVPTRIIVFSYPRTNGRGVPSENEGSEWYCTQGPAASVGCSFAARSGEIAVRLPRESGGSDPYVIVHAAWLGGVTPGGEAIEASASWGWKRTAS